MKLTTSVTSCLSTFFPEIGEFKKIEEEIPETCFPDKIQRAHGIPIENSEQRLLNGQVGQADD